MTPLFLRISGLSASSSVKVSNPSVSSNSTFSNASTFSIKVSSDLDQLLDEDIDIFVFCTNHSEYINNESLIKSISIKKNKNNFIFDTVGVLNENEINILKESHTLKVVGRGDLQ